MEIVANKPRMIFFQWDHSKLPKFMQLHTQLHVKCLTEFFEVVLINEDCDYKQICDMYQPEVTLFESGWKSTVSRRLKIENTSAFPEIVKIGLHNGDGWCESRVSFISDMYKWGINTFFTISTTTAENTPEIAENLYVWPNFIDGEIYRNYDQTKVVPILFNGSMNSLYPWRQKILKNISNFYPHMIFPHLGYENRSSQMVSGEQYARIINASWFVPSCGTIANELVRKHFEVPGSKSCLITEKSPSIEAAGFVDMQNCVFADDRDVLDKLDFLFKEKNELQKIINAGYEFVHTHHTLKQRDQIRQWFDLFKNLKPSEKIIQTNPFKPLSVVEKSTGKVSTPIVSNGLHLKLLRKGDENLWEGKYEEAEDQYLECLKYISWMSEPKFKLAICNLYKGNAITSVHWIVQPIQNQIGIYKGKEPDPIEWAYLIISLLCQGKLNEATIRANQFPMLMHTELERIRWVINYLQHGVDKNSFPLIPSLKNRPSIHQLPQLSFKDWINNLIKMLKACQQKSYEKDLRAMFSSENYLSKNHQNIFILGKKLISKYLLWVQINYLKNLNDLFEISHIPNRRGLPSISLKDFIIRLGKRTKQLLLGDSC
jgi:hypothetical protein